jgi:hypothetical protein
LLNLKKKINLEECKMYQQIINAVVPVAVTALVAVVVAIVKAVGDAAISFAQKQMAALEVKIGADTYNQKLTFAQQAWNMVDEYFRITPAVTKTIEAAQSLFAVEIKKFIPDISDGEIAQLRQAVAGEVNKGRATITASATDTAPATPTAPTTAQ